MFCAQGAHDKYYRHDCKDGHSNFMLLPTELDPNASTKILRNFNATDGDELGQNSYKGTSNYVDRLCSQVQI